MQIYNDIKNGHECLKASVAREIRLPFLRSKQISQKVIRPNGSFVDERVNQFFRQKQFDVLRPVYLGLFRIQKPKNKRPCVVHMEMPHRSQKSCREQDRKQKFMIWRS